MRARAPLLAFAFLAFCWASDEPRGATLPEPVGAPFGAPSEPPPPHVTLEDCAREGGFTTALPPSGVLTVGGAGPSVTRLLAVLTGGGGGSSLFSALGEVLALLWADAELTVLGGDGAPLGGGEVRLAHGASLAAAREQLEAARAWEGASEGVAGRVLGFLVDPFGVWARMRGRVEGLPAALPEGARALWAAAAAAGAREGAPHAALNPFASALTVTVGGADPPRASSEFVVVEARGGGGGGGAAGAPPPALSLRCVLQRVPLRKPLLLAAGLLLATRADELVDNVYVTLGLGLGAALALSVGLALLLLLRQRDRRLAVGLSLAALMGCGERLLRAALPAPLQPLVEYYDVLLLGGVAVGAAVIAYVLAALGKGNPMAPVLLKGTLLGGAVACLWGATQWWPASAALIAAVFAGPAGVHTSIWALGAALFLASLPERALDALLCRRERLFGCVRRAREALGFDAVGVGAADGGRGGGASPGGGRFAPPPPPTTTTTHAPPPTAPPPPPWGGGGGGGGGGAPAGFAAYAHAPPQHYAHAPPFVDPAQEAIDRAAAEAEYRRRRAAAAAAAAGGGGGGGRAGSAGRGAGAHLRSAPFFSVSGGGGGAPPPFSVSGSGGAPAAWGSGGGASPYAAVPFLAPRAAPAPSAPPMPPAFGGGARPAARRAGSRGRGSSLSRAQEAAIIAQAAQILREREQWEEGGGEEEEEVGGEEEEEEEEEMEM
jgi:hypothetical protein